MNIVREPLDEWRAARAGTADAREGVDASNGDRLLDVWVGPIQRTDPESDLKLRREAHNAQRARNELGEVEDEQRRQELGDRATPVSPFLVALALGVLFVIEVVGASIMLHGLGIPLRHRLAVAVAYAIGLVVVTRLTAWLVGVRKAGPLGWVGAGVAIVAYASVIVLGAAARLLIDEEDLSLVELVVEGAVACIAVLGPAVGMHLASVYYLRARPMQKGRRAVAKREAMLLRTLKTAHATLERAQREVREREVRRVRMKGAYLAAHRRELARLAQMKELLATPNPNATPEPERNKQR